MPRVRFTAAPKLPRDMAHKPYREGWEGEMSDDEANRWLRRGVAVIVPPGVKFRATAPPVVMPVSPIVEKPAPAADLLPDAARASGLRTGESRVSPVPPNRRAADKDV